jgi:SAM-dependent methyltransferase
MAPASNEEIEMNGTATAHDRSFSPGEKKWTRLTAEDIDTAYKLPLIKEVYDEETRLIQELADKESVLVEVGCGTGKFCLSQLGEFHTVVGVDISDPFLEFIRRTVPARDDLLLIKGDAANLTQVLNGDPGFQSRVGTRRRVVCCVLNTLGVMPTDIRQAVAAEMARACGDGGRFFLTVFNARHFARGLDELYRRIPHLCGPIEESDIDWRTCDLRVASSGYSSHWFSKSELCALVENGRVKEYDIREGPGVGLYVVADCGKGR